MLAFSRSEVVVGESTCKRGMKSVWKLRSSRVEIRLLLVLCNYILKLKSLLKTTTTETTLIDEITHELI